jgi:Protein of unknown function (DUF2752)
MTQPPAGAIGIAAAATGTLATGALAYIGLADPHRPGFLFPGCPFKILTGWNCPLCGGLRMTHDVLHGDLAAAVVDNVYALVGIPLLVLWLAVCWRRGRPLNSVAPVVVIVASMVIWAVIRNLPGFPLVPTFVSG